MCVSILSLQGEYGRAIFLDCFKWFTIGLVFINPKCHCVFLDAHYCALML